MEWVEVASGKFTRTPCTPWGGVVRASANDIMGSWGICSKGMKKEDLFRGVGKRREKSSVMWENFCCIDRMKESGGIPCVGR